MKSLSLLCAVLIILCSLGFAQEITKGSPSADPRDGGALDQAPQRQTVGTDLRQGGEGCGAAFVIPALPFTESGELGTLDDCAGRPYHDVFYRYTALQSGSHTFDMCGSAGDTYLRIWSDGTCCAGANLVDDNTCGTDYDPRITLTLTAGQVIFIECGKYQQSGFAGTYVFHGTGPSTPPANDLCANATAVAVPSTTMGTTLHANVDAAPLCGTAGNPTAAGVWFRLVGTGNTLTASLCNANTLWDTKLSVFTGPCTGLVCVDGSDDICGEQSRVSWCSDAGVDYWVLVHGYLNYEGAFQLDVTDNGINCHLNCATMIPCGVPAETEPNNVCSTEVDPLLITCPADDTETTEIMAYGVICPAADHDVYHIVVPPSSVLNVIPYGGSSCDSLPAPCVVSDLLANNCDVIGSSSTGGWTITNDLTVSQSYYLDVHGSGACMNRYKIVTSCCALRDYATNPIVIEGVSEYTAVVNTCCATQVVPFVPRLACGGTLYPAGRSVIFRIHPPAVSHLNIETSGGNTQILVFTDPANPAGTCVASSDSSIWGSERIENLTLTAGIYYISVSRFGDVCGDITVFIQSDLLLPAELLAFTAAGGRDQVTLDWQTASETDNERFEIERDGHTVARIASQGNGPSGHTYRYVDTGLENGRIYRYDLYSVNLSGQRSMLKSTSAAPRADGDALVTRYALYQNYPNPFNPATQISFDLLETGFVSLKIYNLMGQQVAAPLSQSLTSGHHTCTFDASSLPSGIYLYRLEVNSFVAEKKMLLMK